MAAVRSDATSLQHASVGMQDDEDLVFPGLGTPGNPWEPSDLGIWSSFCLKTKKWIPFFWVVLTGTWLL